MRIFLPDSFKVLPENVFINIIGRGSCRLSNLETQYAEKVAFGYEHPVGKGEILFEGGMVLSVRHLDLRPDNGIDIVIMLKDSYFESECDYSIHIETESLHSGVMNTVSYPADLL